MVFLQVRQETPGVLYFKKTFDDEEFDSIDLNRRARRKVLTSVALIPLRVVLKPINTKNLMILRNYFFFRHLAYKENNQDDSE